MTHGIVTHPELSFRETLLDVETLNSMALNSELDITKVSCHAFCYLRNRYTLLNAGAALGRGCGPLIISRSEMSTESLSGRTIAIPGNMTTANLLLSLYCSDMHIETGDTVAMPFDRIIPSVAGGAVDAGVIIHESRFTYQAYGLHKIADLGQWWEDVTSLPIPLGVIIARSSLGSDTINEVNTILRQSIEYAFAHTAASMPYIREHSQELSETVVRQHIDLYVNNFSVDLGAEGHRAVNELIERADHAGIIPS